MKAKLAFYIASNGNLVDKTIAWYTKSKYSHVELVVGRDWYSTSPRDLEVRKKQIVPTQGVWDYIDVEVDETRLNILYETTRGAKYDWLGILFSQFIRANKHSKQRWFCSEFCAEALWLEDSNKYSPEDLYQKMKA